MRTTNNRNKMVSDSIGGMLRHASHHLIESITVVVFSDLLPSATLTVRFSDRVYRIKFADYGVLIDFLYNRTSWRGYTFTLYTYVWVDGGFGYHDVMQNVYTLGNKTDHKNARAKISAYKS